MLTLESIGKTVVGRTLFEGLTWTINPRERIGLVGPNGCGKTSLLRIIAGKDEPDEGRVHRHAGLRVSYLPQEVETEISGEAPLLEAVLAGADEVRRLGEEIHRLADAIAEAASLPGEEDRVERLTFQFGERRALFEWFGGDALETRARIVLGGLGFSPQDLTRPVRTFSGGWRMRAVMARMLLSGSDLLLLDEPTNHLDLDALAWLENHLAGSPAGIIIVSHDRVFLDRVVDRIADLARGRLRLTPGGYSAWAAARERERDLAQRRDKDLEREEERLTRFVERFHAKATKAAAARDKARLLEQVQSERAELDYDQSRSVRFRWPDPPHAPELLLKLDGVSKAFGEKVVLAGINLEIRRGQRWALMGPNGAGKTTLLRIITGDLPPDGGRREPGPFLSIGSFAQHQLEAMDGERTVIDEIARSAPSAVPEQLRRALGTMGLGDLHVDRPVRTLSGGERARLALAKLLLRPANLLLLDEPTNHLDLPLREALEQALAAWEGTLLVVSHDRAFLDRVTTGVLAVERGQVTKLEGGWQGWLAWRAESERAAQGERAAENGGEIHERSKGGRRQRAEALQERNRRLRPLREDVSRLERQISLSEQRLAAVDADLGDPTVHTDGQRMRDLARERQALEESLVGLYEQWTAAAHRLEVAEGE